MDRAVDILHPLSSLKWRECRGPPVDVGDAKAVWLKDKVYVGGGGWIVGSRRGAARLYIYTPATDTWDTPIDTPVYHFALTTYHSQLVLVGGREYVGENGEGNLTNKLWILSEHGQWQETLPPLPAPCGFGASAVSHEDHLLMISYDYINNQVYVYNGHHWASAQPPPQRLYPIMSTVFNGHWYLMGQELHVSQETCVYSASIDSLIASCQPSETSQPSSLWKRLTDVPYINCYPAVFGNRLVAVTGRGSYSTASISLYAYSSSTQSWLRRGDTSIISGGLASCAMVLPSNELMVMYGQTAVKATLKMTHFNPESSFTLVTLSFLEEAGIPVRSTLSHYTQRIQAILGLAVYPNLDIDAVLTNWISSVGHTSSTWKNLILIIRLLNLGDLAVQIESYLRGATEEPSPTRGTGGGEDVDEQLRLRDDTIFHLKQENSTLKQRIEELENQSEELKGQLSQAAFREEVKVEVKDEDGEKPLALKYELKSQLSRPIKEEVEEKPVAVLPVKTEIREEANTMTKAETASAQPTTATWNLRGVEVCGEMTVVVSSRAQPITWEGFGLKFHIPEGSLPPGMGKCSIQIRASLTGQYEFPENSHLVSAIFWLRCETVHRFAKPITVEIQHCTKSENVTNLKLSFVRAVCSQKQLPYTFKQLLGGNFTSHSSYGVIELNSFSGVGITQEGSEDREYCSQLFYLGQPNLCQIHFVVTWNIEAHLTEVAKKYEGKGAILGLHQPVEFEVDNISLDIPMEGITIKGWKITPLIRPVVTKKQVDNFREGKLTPCCQLLAEITRKKEKVPVLRHQVNLKGAKYPNDVFLINLPAGDTNSRSRSPTFGDLAAAETGPPPIKRSRLEDADSAKHASDGTTTAGPSSASGLDTLKLDLRTDHFKATSYLQKLDNRQIRYVGGALGLAYDTLDKMKDLPEEMVAAWLRREDFVSMSGEPTWRTLVAALRKVGQEGTARDIEQAEIT